jgi:hypothetical protein
LRKVGTRECFYEVSVFVDYEQAALADILLGSALRQAHTRTVETRQIPYEHKTSAENAERGGQAEALLPLKENRRRASVVNTHDGGVGALQVAAVVEIRNDDVAGTEQAAARKSLRHESDAVRIHVAVHGNRRAVDDGRQERPILIGRCGSRTNAESDGRQQSGAADGPRKTFFSVHGSSSPRDELHSLRVGVRADPGANATPGTRASGMYLPEREIVLGGTDEADIGNAGTQLRHAVTPASRFYKPRLFSNLFAPVVRLFSHLP